MCTLKILFQKENHFLRRKKKETKGRRNSFTVGFGSKGKPFPKIFSHLCQMWKVNRVNESSNSFLVQNRFNSTGLNFASFFTRKIFLNPITMYNRLAIIFYLNKLPRTICSSRSWTRQAILVTLRSQAEQHYEWKTGTNIDLLQISFFWKIFKVKLCKKEKPNERT